MSEDQYIVSHNAEVTWGVASTWSSLLILRPEVRSFTPKELLVNVRARGLLRLTRIRFGEHVVRLADEHQDGARYAPTRGYGDCVPPFLMGRVYRGEHFTVEGTWSDLIPPSGDGHPWQRGTTFLIAVDFRGTADLA